MRILYVALTRAEKKLILTGTIKDEEEIISIARKVQANDTDPTLTGVMALYITSPCVLRIII